MIGRLAGDYEITDRIACGGMGDIYLARKKGETGRFAVKFLGPEERRERFDREIEVLRSLPPHENILPLVGNGELDGVPYYVTHFVDGETLSARIARTGPLPPDQARRILEKAAAATGHLHANGVIHGDVKPENILVSPAGRVWLLDFGTAVHHRDRAEAGGRTIVGTLEYLPPERLSGSPPDYPGDIYALGVLAFELLTGHAPVPGGKNAGGRPPFPWGFPRDWKPAVRRALLADPLSRFARPQDFLRALESGETNAQETRTMTRDDQVFLTVSIVLFLLAAATLAFLKLWIPLFGAVVLFGVVGTVWAVRPQKVSFPGRGVPQAQGGGVRTPARPAEGGTREYYPDPSYGDSYRMMAPQPVVRERGPIRGWQKVILGFEVLVILFLAFAALHRFGYLGRGRALVLPGGPAQEKKI